MIEAVLWDFGGVFTASPFAAAAEAGNDLGLDAGRAVTYVFGPYGEDTDHPWHRLERGEVSLDEAFADIVALAAADGVMLDPWDVLARMSGGDGPVVDEQVLATALSVRARGVRAGLVTNNVAEFRDGWRSLVPVDDLFDVVVDSSEEGVRKPDPRIFALALDRLGGVAPDRAVLLDDYEGNVAAAREFGLAAIRVDPDPAPALTALERLLSA